MEKRQYQRLLGDNYDIAALSSFLEQGEFTMVGWEYALQQLCVAGRNQKLNKQQIKEAKKLAKRASKGQDAENLPVIHLENLNPFALRSLIPHIMCIEKL